MVLFKKLSQDGRITILTTHLLEHAMMFSRIVLMHSGRLIFFGSPQEAMNFFQVNTLSALYSRIKNRPAEEWQEEFQKTDTHRKDVDHARDQSTSIETFNISSLRKGSAEGSITSYSTRRNASKTISGNHFKRSQKYRPFAGSGATNYIFHFYSYYKSQQPVVYDGTCCSMVWLQ